MKYYYVNLSEEEFCAIKNLVQDSVSGVFDHGDYYSFCGTMLKNEYKALKALEDDLDNRIVNEHCDDESQAKEDKRKQMLERAEGSINAVLDWIKGKTYEDASRSGYCEHPDSNEGPRSFYYDCTDNIEVRIVEDPVTKELYIDNDIRIYGDDESEDIDFGEIYPWDLVPESRHEVKKPSWETNPELSQFKKELQALDKEFKGDEYINSDNVKYINREICSRNNDVTLIWFEMKDDYEGNMSAVVVDGNIYFPTSAYPCEELDIPKFIWLDPYTGKKITFDEDLRLAHCNVGNDKAELIAARYEWICQFKRLDWHRWPVMTHITRDRIQFHDSDDDKGIVYDAFYDCDNVKPSQLIKSEDIDLD